MSLPELTPEQAAEAERLYRHLRPVVEAELRQLTRSLASKADDKLLGKAEFEVRDRVHTIGAKALEAALNERKKGATKAPASAARTAMDPASSKIDATRPS
ncbi:hypothetical protein AB1L88_26860 [Tautonia sp. JC769]|uniref:hypothetical protein n=1 Tax=Tautonia sp. JC769 TaxID=3232135 RepID=UPI00345AE524